MAWTSERWQRIEALFHEVATCEPSMQAQKLLRECGNDHELRLAVERLLAADAAPEDALLDHGLAGALHGKDPLLQQHFGPFRLVERIADGGMCTVYRAQRQDGEFEQEVAIKVLRVGLQTPAMRERFARERRTLARLVHPNVARLLDGGTTEQGVPFLVMEFVDGVRFDRYCDQQAATLRQRLTLFATVCRTVHFAHQNLIVHLDLKPSNILVDTHGVCKLVDFGVAGLLEGGLEGAAAVAATRSRPLTPEYASPELLRGEAISTAADVYALGVVLYELLTGVRAFRPTRSDLDLMKAVCETEAPRPSSVFGDRDDHASPSAQERASRRSTTPRELHKALLGDLDRIVSMAMRKEPGQRYGSCEDLAEDIERWLGGFPVRARETSFGYRARKFVRRNALAVGAAAAVVLALVLGLVSTLHMAAVARGERDVAAAATRDAERERDAVAAAHDRIAHEVEHARIETASHRHVASFLSETFLSGQHLGQHEHREPLLATIERKAAQVRRQQVDNPHLQANLLDALGQACVALDAFEPAVVLVREAMALRQVHFGADSLEHALSLGSLGQLCYRRGELAAARVALRESYRLHKECRRDVHTDVAQAANDLAAVERALGDRERARELHHEALALRRQAGDALLVAESLNNLANAESDRGRAKTLLEESCQLREQVLGADDPLTIQSLSNRGTLALAAGDVAGAKELLVEAIRRSRGLGALGAEGLAISLRALAYAERQLGAVVAARAAIEEALGLDRDRLGPRHPRVASALEVRATIEEAGQDWSAAVATWQEVRAIRQDMLPAGHRQIGLAVLSLGGAEVSGHTLVQGLAHLDEALAILSQPGESRSTDVADCQRLRGQALEQLHRLADAEQALLAAEQSLAESVQDARRVAALRAQLRQFYLRRGRPDDAARYAER